MVDIFISKCDTLADSSCFRIFQERLPHRSSILDLAHQDITDEERLVQIHHQLMVGRGRFAVQPFLDSSQGSTEGR